jgi:hypothetical protein
MTDFSNYYQIDHRKNKDTSTERFPGNHVKFSALLKLLDWVDTAYGLFGLRAFKTKNAMLKEYDSAAPLDEYIGSETELKQFRDLVVLYCESIDNNPYLSPIGRFLLKKLSLNILKNRKRVLQYYLSDREYIDA